MSRETLLLVNNVLLLVACAAVLLGTLYPLFADAFMNDKISVGKPFFDTVFAPLMLPLVFVLGIGPLTRWKRDSIATLARRTAVSLIIAIALGIAATAMLGSATQVMVVISLALSAWVILTTLQAIWGRLANKRNKAAALLAMPAEFMGMTMAHIGLAVFVVGVTITSTFSTERDVSLRPGESHELAGYRFEFGGVEEEQGPNYRSQMGRVRIYDDDELIAVLRPEKRHYPIQAQPMTEASVNVGAFRDLYVALGEQLGDRAWSVRLYHKPFVRWIWLGPVLMVLGGLLAAADRRYRSVPLRNLTPRETDGDANAAARPGAALT